METPVVETVSKIEYLGEEQYTKFFEERRTMHEASYRHTAQEHVGTLQSFTDQDAVKAEDATCCSEE